MAGSDIRLLESHVERVFKDIVGVLLHRPDRSGGRVVIKQPLEMRPEEIDERAVRDRAVRLKTRDAFGERSPTWPACLATSTARKGKTMLEPLGHDEAAVGQQPVIAESDAHPVKRNPENGQGDAGPAKQPGDERGQRGHVNHHDGADIKPDHLVGANGRRDRSRGTLVAGLVNPGDETGSNTAVGAEPRSFMSDRSPRSY